MSLVVAMEPGGRIRPARVGARQRMPFDLVLDRADNSQIDTICDLQLLQRATDEYQRVCDRSFPGSDAWCAAWNYLQRTRRQLGLSYS